MNCCTNFYEHPLVEAVLGPSWHPGGLDLTRRLAAHLSGRVLDVACGSGTSAEVLRSEFGLPVVGFDARRKRPPCLFVRGRAPRFPFREQSFNGVLLECALSTFEDPLGSLVDLRRTLRVGGTLAISDMTVEGPLPPEFEGVVASVACLIRARSHSGWEELLRQAGFSGIRGEDRGSDLDALLTSVTEKVEGLRTLGIAVDGILRPLAIARTLRQEGRLGYAAFVAERGESATSAGIGGASTVRSQPSGIPRGTPTE